MKNLVYVPSESQEPSIRFYVDDLQLFDVSEDLGMGSVLLQRRGSEDFYLMLSPELQPREDGPLFSVAVKNCEMEFDRLKQIHFKDGGMLLPHDNGKFGVIEYPLGKFFKMRDPARNILVIYEWFN